MIVFFRIPVNAPNTLGTIPQSNIVELKDTYVPYTIEAEAFGHWMFKNNLTDEMNSRNLAPIPGATYTLTNGMITLDTNQLNGIQSGMKPTAGIGYTVCAVIRVKNTANASTDAQLAGTQTSTAGTASLRYYPATNQIGGNVVSAGLGSANKLAANKNAWQFMAVSFSGDAQVVRNLLVADTLHGVLTDTITGTGPIIGTTSAQICLGANTASTVTIDFDCAEFIVFAGPKSINELNSIYTRSKERMATKSILI